MKRFHSYNDNLNCFVRGQYRDVNKYASSAFYKKIISGETYPVLYRMLASDDDWENSHRKGKDSYIFDKDVGDVITFKQLTSTTSKKPDEELITKFMNDVSCDEDIDTIIVLKNAKGLPVDYNSKLIIHSNGHEVDLERFRYQEEVITFGKFRIDRIYEDKDIFPGFKTTVYECSTLDQSKELAFDIQKDKYYKIKNDTYDIYESVLNESYKDFDAQTIEAYVKNFKNHIKDYEDVSEFLDDLNL